MKYHGIVSLKIEGDNSSAETNKKAQSRINVISRKTEIPLADKAELTAEPRSRHKV